MPAREFLLPDLGEGLEDAEVLQWLVAEGDRVELNQPLVEVNTAKATVPALVDAGGGTFIVIGSGAGRANSGGLGAYSAAKAGASALTRVLADSLRPTHR